MHNNLSPLVSIIVPAYNASHYLGQLIESIICQDYLNWELIIVDDHSSDDTFNVIKQFEPKDHRIHGYKRPNDKIKGGDACRNYGFSIAKGELIMFIDADDLLAPYCIKQRTHAMITNPDIDFGVFPALSFKEKPLDYNIVCYGFKTSTNPLKHLINKALPFVVWNNIYRRDSLSKNKILWDENLMSNQDADFNIQCIIRGLQFKEFDVLPDYFWRQIPTSTSKKILTKSHAQSNIYYFNKITNIFQNNRDFSNDLKILSLWILGALLRSGSKESLNLFLESKFLNKHTFFKCKIKYCHSLLLKGLKKDRHIYLLIKLIIFPYISLLSRWNNCEFPFKNRMHRKVITLVQRYQKYLSEHQKKTDALYHINFTK